MLDPAAEIRQNLINLYNRGEAADVSAKVEELLDFFPRSCFLWNIFGAANLALGSLDKAEKAYRNAVKISPKFAEGFNNLGVVFKDKNSFKEAEKFLQQAIKIKPEFAAAYNNLGIVLNAQGRRDEAIHAYEMALKFHPGFLEPHISLAKLHEAGGDIDKAIFSYEAALEIEPTRAEAHYNLGSLFRLAGRFEDAINAYRDAIKQNPKYAEAYNNLGVLLQDCGELQEAVTAYKKAIQIKPDYVDAKANFGACLYNLGLYHKGIHYLSDELKKSPLSASLLNTYGSLMQKEGQITEAINYYEKALEISPKDVNSMNNLGTTLAMMGKFCDAKKLFKKSIKLYPKFATAYYNLSGLIDYDVERKYVEDIERLHANEPLLDVDKSLLSFALANIYDERGETEAAFSKFLEANSIAREIQKYNLDTDVKFFSKVKTAQDDLGLSYHKIDGKNLSTIPIFILGMPRSGTTLLEQILSSHSKVSAGGELEFINRFGCDLSTGKTLPTASNVEEFRTNYINATQILAQKNRYLTDKMPLNFRFIGVIRRAFPEAKIISVKRKPEAVCWSNFKCNFGAPALGFSNDLMDIVSYYNLYKNLMDFWKNLFGNDIYELDYEALTLNPQTEITKIIGYLDLNIEEEVFSPQSNNRSVSTASKKQIRQGIYTGSSNNWEKYQFHLDNIFDALNRTT